MSARPLESPLVDDEQSTAVCLCSAGVGLRHWVPRHTACPSAAQHCTARYRRSDRVCDNGCITMRPTCRHAGCTTHHDHGIAGHPVHDGVLCICAGVLCILIGFHVCGVRGIGHRCQGILVSVQIARVHLHLTPGAACHGVFDTRHTPDTPGHSSAAGGRQDLNLARARLMTWPSALRTWSVQITGGNRPGQAHKSTNLRLSIKKNRKLLPHQ